jgi:tetratricopeptide (TPR) repeat protein
MRTLLCVLFLAGSLVTVSLAQQPAPPAANAAVTAAEEFFQKKDWPNAIKAYQALATQEPSNGRYWYRLGMAYFGQANYQQAAEALRKAEAIGHNPTVMYNLACTYARLNEKDQAFDWLNQTAQRGFRQAQMLETDNDLAGLRADPRFPALLEKVRANAQPCTQTPEARQFDFWIGEWEVKNTLGQTAGQSSVQMILGKCVLLENWTDALGNSGKSFNVFNRQTRQWHQTWVDDQGSFTEYKQGEYKDGKLTYLAEQIGPNGQKQWQRMTFFNLGPERVRQFGELSTDGGKTWQVSFDLMYHRKGPEKAARQ